MSDDTLGIIFHLVNLQNYLMCKVIRMDSDVNKFILHLPTQQTLKKLVWAKCVDELCAICEDPITKKEFEAGHIIARTLGGQIDIDNLIPICFDCNRTMGTRNAWEYKKDMYPEHEFAGQEN